MAVVHPLRGHVGPAPTAPFAKAADAVYQSNGPIDLKPRFALKKSRKVLAILEK